MTSRFPRISLRIPRIAWIVLTIALFAFYAARSWKAEGNDFIAYYNAGTRVLSGHSPYAESEATPFRYLPMTAFLFAPLSLFSFKVARLLLFIANFSAAAFLYRKIGARIGGLATALLLLLFFRFHNHDFQNAQVNPLLLLLFFFWWAWRERNLPFATLAFAIFASFKIVPFAICLPLLCLKRWNEVQWIGLWAVVLNFLPVFFVDNGPLVFQDWYQQARQIEYPAVTLPNVQSFQSALWWLLKDSLAAPVFATFMHFLQAAALIAILFLVPNEQTADGFGRKANWAIASTLAATALLTPLAWKHNYLQFLPLIALWFFEDPNAREKRTRLLYGISLLGIVFLPSAIASWHREFSDRLYLMPWTGMLVIFLGLYWAKRAQILPIEK
jgi:hypothetical protein